MGKNKRNKEIKYSRIIITILLTVLVFALNVLNNKSNTEQDSLKREESKEEYMNEIKSESDKDIINVLILGVDTNNMNKINSRTDTIIVGSLNLKESKASIISIPRDTKVNIKGKKNKDKINHAHVYGGVSLTIDTVEELLNIPIHNYIKIDYQALKRIVDEIGGVEIYVPIDMKYSDPYAEPPLNINLKKGQQVLSGEEAIQFVRYRKGYNDQDIGRISSQQNFIRAMLEEIIKPQNVTKIPKLIDIIVDYTETDLTKSQIVKYGLKSLKIKPSEINMVTLPGESTYTNGIWFYEINQNEIETIVSEIK